MKSTLRCSTVTGCCFGEWIRCENTVQHLASLSRWLWLHMLQSEIRIAPAPGNALCSLSHTPCCSEDGPGWGCSTCEHGQSGCLPGTIVSQEDCDLPLIHVQGQVPYCLLRLVPHFKHLQKHQEKTSIRRKYTFISHIHCTLHPKTLPSQTQAAMTPVQETTSL